MPSGVTFTLAGFRSRWTMPLLVRLLERLGDLLRDRDRLVDGDRPALQALGEVFALHELHHDEVSRGSVVEGRGLEAVEVGDARVVEGGEQPRLALEARQPLGIGGERLGQQLDRHVAAELRVGRAVDLAHPSGAEGRQDLVGAQTAAALRGQGA